MFDETLWTSEELEASNQKNVSVFEKKQAKKKNKLEKMGALKIEKNLKKKKKNTHTLGYNFICFFFPMPELAACILGTRYPLNAMASSYSFP